MQRSRKVVVGMLLAALLVLNWMMAAWAAEPINEENALFLSIQYENSGQPLVGASFKLYRVADMDDRGVYTLTEDFQDLNVDLNVLESEAYEELADLLVTFIDKQGRQPVDRGQTDAKGSLTFPVQQQEMLPGLYLVRGEDYTSDQMTYVSVPFFVQLPAMDYKADEWSYAVTARPKCSEDEVTPEQPQLPQTGMVWWPVPVMACSGLLFVLLGWIRCRKNE